MYSRAKASCAPTTPPVEEEARTIPQSTHPCVSPSSPTSWCVLCCCCLPRPVLCLMVVAMDGHCDLVHFFISFIVALQASSVCFLFLFFNDCFHCYESRAFLRGLWQSHHSLVTRP